MPDIDMGQWSHGTVIQLYWLEPLERGKALVQNTAVQSTLSLSLKLLQGY